MNIKDRYKLVNKNIRTFLDSNSKHILAGNGYNKIISINVGNTLAHERTKFTKAYELLSFGHVIATETKLKSGKRPDILVLDLETPMAYEIIKTETKESIEKKRKEYYPIMVYTVEAL